MAKADHVVSVIGSRTLGNREGRVAIRLETKELGSITFEVDRRSIATLRKELDAAEAFLNKKPGKA